MAAPAVQSSATAYDDTSVASIVITQPTGVVSGDLLVATITVRSAGNTITSTGWTAIYTEGVSGATHTTLYKIAGGSEPSSYTFSWTGGNGTCCGGVVRIDGHDATTPVDVSAGNNANSNNLAAPTVTTTVDECLVLRFYHHRNPSYTVSTPPTSHTEIFTNAGSTTNSGTYVDGHAYEIDQVTAGATGTATLTMSGSNFYTAQTVAIAPSAGGGPTFQPAWASFATRIAI